jgi:hypothetical protein
MISFETLYGRKGNMLVSWDNPTDHTVVGLEIMRKMEEKMVKKRNNLKVVQDMHKIYEDKGRTHREFKVGNHVFFKVKFRHSSLKLGNCSKLAMHYCGPFEILERIGLVTYIISFPAPSCIHNVFCVSIFLKYYLILIILLIGM